MELSLLKDALITVYVHFVITVKIVLIRKYRFQFINDVLGLEEVLDQGWVRVWRTSQAAYVGATDVKASSITVKERGGTLISLIVKDVASWYDRLKPLQCHNIRANLPDNQWP